MDPGKVADRAHRLIKCVVWDLDNTLWPGIVVESPTSELPQPNPGVLDIINRLEQLGIASSVASRNDPSMLSRLLAHPLLQNKFVFPQVSWEPKSQSLRRIAEKLNISIGAVAFVDDSPFERAEVAFMLPQVLVLSPDEVACLLDDPGHNAGNVTAEGSRRTEMYRQEEQRRVAEKQFAGSREDFLNWCEMRLTIAPAGTADLDRIAELTERTHQLNSTGRKYAPEELLERIGSERWLVPAARLTDRFGDYGLIGAAVVDRQVPWPPRTWLAELVMLSCRVEGRGIPAALLLWVIKEARDARMDWVRAVYRTNEQNLPMRLLFRQMGLKSVGVGELMVAARSLSEPIPDYPPWLHVNTGSEVSL